MNLKLTLKLFQFLSLLTSSLLLAACGYPTPDRTTGLTPFVVVVTPTPDSAASPTIAATTAAATTAAPTTAAPTTPPATTAQQAVTSYTVEEGDTLLAIANKLGVDVRELQKLNNIEDPSKLQIDTVLKIPPKKTANPTSKP